MHQGVAKAAQRNGLHEEAVRHLESALATQPSNAYGMLAQAYGRLGRHEDAALAWTRHIELYPRDASAHAGRARTFLLLRRAGEAARDFRRAAELAPPGPNSYARHAASAERPA